MAKRSPFNRSEGIKYETTSQIGDLMTKKRKSGGRNKGKKGNNSAIQCSKCGRLVPADKVKKVTRRVSVVDYRLASELRKEGTIIPTRMSIQYLCVSCGVHTGRIKVRSKNQRKGKEV